MSKRKNPAAVALGKLGGKAKSEAKARASAENGKKGGRPTYRCRKCGERFSTTEAEALDLRDHLVLHHNGKEWCGPVFRIGGRPRKGAGK